MVAAEELPHVESTFKPHEHFRSLKGQQYLEVKYRIIWFREEHPEGCIATEVVSFDWEAGVGLVKARVSYPLPDGREVFATGYGDESRKDFGDFLTKAETKAVGRALAHLGYGTQFAQELEEGERGGEVRVADSPVPPRRPSAPARPPSGPTGASRGERAGMTPAGATSDRPAVSETPAQLAARYLARVRELEKSRFTHAADVDVARQGYWLNNLGRMGTHDQIETWDAQMLLGYGRILAALTAPAPA